MLGAGGLWFGPPTRSIHTHLHFPLPTQCREQEREHELGCKILQPQALGRPLALTSPALPGRSRAAGKEPWHVGPHMCRGRDERQELAVPPSLAGLSRPRPFWL